MSIAKTTKYAFFGLYCVFYSFLLLTLSGCNATSDSRPVYQTTGSWQGTIGTDQVQGIIAPDRTYQLAIIDAGGNPVGAYVGAIGSVDAENLGSMTLIRLHTTENAGAQQQFTFKLSADRLFSLQGVELTRTAEANGPAVPSAVAGHWSLAAADNLTDMVINADGTLSGGDSVNCRYTGTLNLISPAWNIFSLNMALTDIPGKLCTDSDYSGLAMILPPENERRRLWFAANNRIVGGARTLFGEWSETVNVAPVAQMTILGERTDQSVLVQEGAAVELDARGSSDANNDLLTYTWSGTAPDGISPLNIQGTGGNVTFVPVRDAVDPNKVLTYTFNLNVSDGIMSSLPLSRVITVVWTPDRFIGCANGTVLDTKTNLLWLQNAWCSTLNGFFGVAPEAAQLQVDTQLKDGVCGLLDGSQARADKVPPAAGDWRLPTNEEFVRIVASPPFAAPPALLNDKGTGQWIEGFDAFTNVGNPGFSPGFNIYTYWTADSAPGDNWYFVNFNYNNLNPMLESSFKSNINPVWPVRALRPGEQCPAVPVP